MDRRLNSRVRVNLNAMTRPQLGDFDKLVEMPKATTFEQLATAVRTF